MNELRHCPADQIQRAFLLASALCQQGRLGPAVSRVVFSHPEEMVEHTYRLPRGRETRDGGVEYPIEKSRQDRMRAAQLSHPLHHHEGHNSWDDAVREMEDVP